MLKRDLGNGAPDLGTDVQPDLLQDHRAVTADAVAVDHMRDLAVLAGLLDNDALRQRIRMLTGEQDATGPEHSLHQAVGDDL